MDKTIEAIRSAMEKEEMAKNSEKFMDEEIDESTADDEANEQIIFREDNEMLKGQKEEGLTENDNPSNEQVSPEEATPSKPGKSFLKSAKSKELAAKEERIQELNDKLIRNMAEFDNFRKRSDKEKSQMFDLGVKNIIEKLLPVIDNFERGLSSVNEEDKDSPLVQGFNMIYKQLMTTMDEIGVKIIEAVGNEFDPNYHNAVLHGEDEELGENIVSEEFQKGYMYHETVVRHSMVKVVN